MTPEKGRDEQAEVERLLARIKDALPALETLLARCRDHWGCEDGVYRFYHQSFKVYHLQGLTTEIVKALKALAPGRPLNGWLVAIVAEGTGRTFEMEHNREWLPATRPIVEAFFHAQYFLEMACKYDRELAAPPAVMPSGWAALLCLHGLR